MIFTECTCCGKDFPKLNPTKIEGAIIDVCERCSRFGTKVSVSQPLPYTPIKNTISVAKLEEDGMELVPEYGKLITQVRESKGLSRYDFAIKLNEKESILKRIEDQDFEPHEDLVKRIENFLDIRLREKVDGTLLRRDEKKKIDLTVGDIVEVS